MPLGDDEATRETSVTGERHRPTVTIVGLGPAGTDLLTERTTAAIAAVPTRFLRTAHHPAAAAVVNATTFDDVYECAATFDEVYAQIVERLVQAARDVGEVLYAVPGSPVVAERTVELLLADDRVDTEVVAAMSFADLAWARLGVDPVNRGARIVDGRDFALATAGSAGPFLVAQCHSSAVLSDIKLTHDDGPVVTILQRLGLADEHVVSVPWAELDRAVCPDHLTAVFIPELGRSPARELQRFAALVARLRDECPWDREQTHASLRRHLLEETYEVLDAIDGLDEPAGYDHLCEELGDLLFQVFFHAVLAAEEGAFDLADVAATVHDKLRDRHPHVFANATAGDADAVLRNWEELKKREKGRSSVMDGVPGGMPALLYASKILKKAAAAGLEPDGAAVPEPVDGGSRIADEAAVGAALFAIVAQATAHGIDPESALRSRARHFEALARSIEG